MMLILLQGSMEVFSSIVYELIFSGFGNPRMESSR